MSGLQHLNLDDRQRPMAEQSRVLVVDDDPLICRLLDRFLSGEGFEVEAVTSGRSMWQKLESWPSDLLILDLKLPSGEDGLSLARSIRQQSEIAIIMLTGRSDCVDKIVGLEVGADDYVTKPFEPRELLARIRSVLRRSANRRAGSPNGSGDGTGTSDRAGHNEVLRFAGWMLDLDRRVLTDPDGEIVDLTSYEFELLAALATRPSRPLSRDMILDIVAHREWGPDDRSIDVLVGKLRRKLNDNPKSPELIKTVRGLGYVFTSIPTVGERD
ncbi:MAG: response regulator [Geminicoccaceae bacterium]